MSRVEVFGGGDFIGRKNRERFERIARKVEAGEPLTPIERAYAAEALRRVAAKIPDKRPKPPRRGNPKFSAEAKFNSLISLEVVDMALRGATAEQIVDRLYRVHSVEVDERSVRRLIKKLTRTEAEEIARRQRSERVKRKFEEEARNKSSS